MPRRKRAKTRTWFTVDSRVHRHLEWIVWHLYELMGVVVLTGLAVTVSSWMWLALGAFVAEWAMREVRLGRQQATILYGLGTSGASADDAPSADSDVDTISAGSESPTDESAEGVRL